MDENRRVWAAFIGMALAWGTSFLFIKIALESVTPLTLVSLRLIIGWLALMVILRISGRRLPRDAGLWRHFFFLGLVNTAIPFVLITWAESGPQGVDSAMASVLNSTVPLFSIIIAGVIVKIEPVTPGRIMGLLVGFAGVVLLLGRGVSGPGDTIKPALAMVVAAICYAISSVYARINLRGVNAVVIAAGQLLVAVIATSAAALLVDDIGEQSLTLAALGAILWLGLMGSCLAYILYFYVLGEWGATRTTTVTYLLPVVGVTAGVLVLNETLDFSLVAGGLLILSGVALVNWRPNKRPPSHQPDEQSASG